MRPLGGEAELGVFPAFLWAKQAAWLSLERHTRRVKHSAPSCLNAGACRKKKASTGIMLMSRFVPKRPRWNLDRKQDGFFCFSLQNWRCVSVRTRRLFVAPQASRVSRTAGVSLNFLSGFHPRCFLLVWSQQHRGWPASLRHDMATCFHWVGGPECWYDSCMNWGKSNLTLGLSAKEAPRGNKSRGEITERWTSICMQSQKRTMWMQLFL